MNFNIPPFKSAIKYGRKKALYSQQNSFFINTDLPRYWAYMRDLKMQNPDVTLEEFEQLVIDDYFLNLATKIFEANWAFENYMDLQSCKYLASNHSRFNEIYEKVSQPDFQIPVTNETFEDYLVSFVHGCIFEHKDDILDVIGDVEELGKPVGNDIEKHKSTFITKYGLEESINRLNKITEDAVAIIGEFENGEFLKELAIYIRDRKK